MNEKKDETNAPTDELTPEERAHRREIRRATIRRHAGLHLVQQVERDLADQGVLGPNDRVELIENENGEIVAEMVTSTDND